MRRAVAVVAVVLALTAGTAAADTFEIVPSYEPPVSRLFVPPSADVPNEPGSLLLPTNAFAAPLGLPRELSYEELSSLWQRAAGAYGIPWQVLASINKIESNFGRNMGPSSAGAVGWMQFMPDTWLRWGTDASGDGIADPWDPDDAVFAAARYLAAAGGRADIARAVFAYNHAQWYVDEVLQLAGMIGGGVDADVVFTLDRLAVALDEAQRNVAAANESLRAAEEREEALRAESEAAAAQADDRGMLLSDRLPAQKQAYQAEALHLDATAEVDRLSNELERAEAVLEAAQSGAHASSFAPAAAGLLGGPSRADGYVFPVGGGLSVVSVGHHHHDYPAADIAAPEGTPVYALADAVVLAPVEDSMCGIGFTLQTVDGLVWVYCHLSYRDDAVQAGAVLTAGQLVGLVGSTGNSTGPHLHLGLRPARYPQEMTWFQEFAGVAFSWQDAPTAEAPQLAPIFAVAPAPAEDVVEFTLQRG